MDLLGKLFHLLWTSYADITPQAAEIHKLLEERGESIENDHIALRTFAHPAIDIEVLDRAFVGQGYEPIESYEFSKKKLVACHYEHPEPGHPKVFISALLIDQCSQALRNKVDSIVEQIPKGLEAQWNFAASGRTWQMDYASYEELRQESEYAAWVAAFGFRANHFTVAAHKLKTLSSLAELNQLLKDKGMRLSQVGGEIKGSAEIGLEQSSTVADEQPWLFSDGEHSIPTCYYEFAFRHPMANGELFEGFIADNATHLFESTTKQ